jgi:UDP-N-acetylmuramoyl-L-alanyl-D-glutamate--2,6-diaminopimelate ligase
MKPPCRRFGVATLSGTFALGKEASAMRQIQRRSRLVRLQELVPQASSILGEDSSKDILCSGCTSDPSRVRPGDLFVAIISAEHDCHEQAQTAIDRGAVAIVSEQVLPLAVPQAIVDDSRQAYGYACQALAEFPCRTMPVIGVTGTLGKTTTALLIASVLNTKRQGVATLTTLAHCDSVKAVAAKQTTPVAEELAGYLASAVQHRCSHAVVELSSAGLAERRAAGTELAVAVLTNVRRDHIKQHGAAANYRAAKEMIFDLLRDDGVAVLNADDSVSQSILSRLNRPTLTYSLHGRADVTATVLERSSGEQTFLIEAGADAIPVRTRILGDHHVYNCLAATAVGLLYGLSLATIARGLEAVETIPGHMEQIDCGQDFGFFIDDARSHDALAMCLKTARQVTSGRVICVMSAAKDRDAAERPLLGRVLEKLAAVAIITGESGKADKSLATAHDVLDGYERPGKAHIIPSRDKAIRWAIETAQPGDTIVVCGAGHRSWRSGGKATDDATFAKQELYQLVAASNRLKPLIYAFSG